MAIELRDYQISAIDALLKAGSGIMKAPAGSGKCLAAAGLVDKWLGDSTGFGVLWLANTKEQCQQAQDACDDFELSQRCRLDIACYQSGLQAKDYDLVILDECHHIAAEEFRKCLDGYDGPRWGFTATDKRADELADDVYTLIGPVVYEVPREPLIAAGRIVPAKVYFLTPNEPEEMQDQIEDEAKIGAEKMKSAVNFVAVQMLGKSVEQVSRIADAYRVALAMCDKYSYEIEGPIKNLKDMAVARMDGDADRIRSWLTDAAKKEILSRARWHSCQGTGVFENAARNECITNKTIRHKNDSTLILVGSIEHGELLCAGLKRCSISAVVIHSKMGAKKRREAIAAFRDGTLKCAIATSLADEGLDVPRANVLILAAAGRSDAKSEQRTGRVLRSWGDKSHGTIYDFWDWQHPLLLNQSRARAKVYHRLKYEFVGAERVLPIVLKSLGIKIHPAIGMEKNLSKAGRRNADEAMPQGKVTEERSNSPENVIPPAQNNLPVPVPAETVERKTYDTGGESRESNEAVNNAGVKTENADSRGGQKISQERGCINPTPQVSSASPEPPNEPLNTHETPTTLPSVGLQQPAGPVKATDNPAAVPSSLPGAHAARTHSRLSPSTLKSKAICSGFINDPEGDKTAANRGTLGHEGVEKRNPDLAGEDEQLRAGIKKCMAYEERVRQTFFKLGIKPVQSFSEIRLYYFDQWGHADLILIGDTRAKLIDWKFAYNWYEADSPQFWAYCKGVWDKWTQVEEIEVHVGHPFLNATDVVTFTRKEHYETFSVAIKAIAAKAVQNDPASYRITDQCRYCGFAGKCVKLAQLGYEIGKRYSTEIVVPDINFHGSQVTDANVMAVLLKLAPIVKKASGGWTKAGLEMYDNGTEIPGFKIVHKSGARSIVSAQAAYQIIKEHFIPDLTVEAFLTHCDVSVTGADQLVSDATAKGSKGKPGKADAVKLLQAHLMDADVLTTGGGSRYLMAEKEAAE